MAMRIIRIVLIITVFLSFAFLASFHRQAERIVTTIEVTVVDTASSSAIVAPPPIDIRELALALPDSLLPFCHGLNSSKEVALSFDACPTSGENHFNRTIANTLIETKTPATIFLSGRWVQEDTAATQLLATDSLIELGNHSFTHPHLTHLTEARIKKELERTQTIIHDLTGQTPFLFRAPYGEYNDTLIRVAKGLGLVTVQFSVASGDPDTSFTAGRLVNWLTRETRNGSIVIMHINNRGWHTAQALPTIISSLRAKGYRLVRVSDLIREVSENLTEPTLAHSPIQQSGDPGEKDKR